VSARIALRKPMMPCSKKNIFATISPKNVGGGKVEKNFPDIQKRGEKIFPDINQLN
jgi:hypothetical protein